MRILTVTNLYPSPEDPTFGTFVGDQVRALRAHPRVELCDVMFIDGRRSTANYARALPELRRRLRQASFDVILAHYGLAGAIAVTQRRVPVVVTFHGGDVLEKSWQLAVSRQAYRLAVDSISVSLAGRERLPGPAHHLTCGIDLELFRPRDRAPARERFGVRHGELAALFPSSPDRAEKMYGRFVAVLDELRRRGHRVHELQLRGLDRPEVPELMAAADVMLLTSRREATPVSIMEALACGLPVVATPVGDVRAMLQGAASAVVRDFDPAAFADATERLLASVDGARSPDPASRQFDETALIEQLLAILEAAAGDRGSVAGAARGSVGSFPSP